jgi:hypothetical protein
MKRFPCVSLGVISMVSVKSAVSSAGVLCLGVLAALGIYAACVLVTFVLGGSFYSMTLGAVVAPVVILVIVFYRWMWRRAVTSWPTIAAMAVTQVVIAALAVQDSPSAAFMWFH